MPGRDDWVIIFVIAIITGGICSFVGVLIRFGFDRNGTLAFVGAIVGAAIAVGLTIAFDGHAQRRAEKREKRSVQTYLDITEGTLREALTTFSDVNASEGTKMGTAHMLTPALQNLASFLTEAVETGIHFDFWTRAWLRESLASVESTITIIDQTMKAADEPHGTFDSTKVQSDIRNLLNGFQLVIGDLRHPLA